MSDSADRRSGSEGRKFSQRVDQQGEEQHHSDLGIADILEEFQVVEPVASEKSGTLRGGSYDHPSREQSMKAPKGVEDIFEEFFEGRAPRTEQAGQGEDQAQADSLTDRPAVLEKELEELLDREGELLAGEPRQGQLYRDCQAFVLESIQRADQGGLPGVDGARRLVREIIDSLGQGAELLLAATDRGQEFSVSTHAVNVTILALELAKELKYSDSRQVWVGMAGLLHEVGAVKLPVGLLYKSGQLNQAEVDLLRQRAVYGGEILRQLGEPHEELAEIVEQVFEREDGTGFPRGLTGKEIREEAKLIAMADVFEACIHDRPYRQAVTGYQAVLELTSQGTRCFSDRIVKALMKGFSLYPYNEFVVLNSGEIAQVVDINRENMFRPWVNIVYDRNGGRLDEPRLTNLAENPGLYVEEAITRAALPDSRPE